MYIFFINHKSNRYLANNITSKNAESKSRYATKIYNERFFVNSIKNLIDKIPITKLAKNPTKTFKSKIKVLEDSTIFSNAATTIIGILNKNENLAASCLVKPNSIPAEIVDPDLEIPGKRANA